MGSENEEQHDPGLPVESKVESQMKSKISYTREFLLSFSELDVCKSLPAGFDVSILSEFEASSYIIPERQRNSGGLSLQSSRYGSSPPNRVDSGPSSYSRGSHGRWDTRSSGSNDKDGDSQSDWDSFTQDSGRRYGNQSRRSWQNPEHDGLLGSGAFPRPSGYTGGALAPKVRGNDNFLLNKSSEPYHPPRPYKALPHLRRDPTDTFNDETFGSDECSSEDRAEEERKRRASFESMRKEQQKALQEKLKHPDKHKEQLATGIDSLFETSDDGRKLWSKTCDESEGHVTHAPQSDSGKQSLSAETPASRPLVPPGFASAMLEKNLGAKAPVPAPASEVGSIGFEDDVILVGHTRHSLEENGPGNDHENDNLIVIAPSQKQQNEIGAMGVPFMCTKEKTALQSSGIEVSDHSFGFENPNYRTSSLQEARENWADSTVTDIDAKNVASCGLAVTVDQDNSKTILDKLFGNALAVNGVGSPSFVENHDVKSDGDAWGTVASQTSKFAHWFHEDEKKAVDDHSSATARDLLSLIVSNEKGGGQLSADSDAKAIEPFQTISPSENEVTKKLMASSSTSSAVGTAESLYYHSKPDTSSRVLTCEDLEQSILAEVNESSAHLHSTQGPWTVLDAKVEMKTANVDDLASQHLLSLLQKGTSMKETSTPIHDTESSNTLGILGLAGVADSASASARAGNTENAQNTEKNLTLEALFGKAFMKELHSVGAPVSTQRGPVGGGIRTDVPEPQGLPYSVAGDGFFHSTVNEYASNKPGHEINSLVLNHPQETLSDRSQGHWLGLDGPQTNGSKFVVAPGFDDRADDSLDIRLPEEESLISMGDPMNHETSKFMHVGAAARREELISSEASIDIVDKLAALNTMMKEERPMRTLDSTPVYHDAYNPVESELQYQHLHGRPSSPQFPPQMNHIRPSFNLIDHHIQRNPQINFIGPESVHHDPHAFPPNIFPHPFHGPGGPRIDPAHHSLLPQHMPPMPGNFPPTHLLQGLPRGVPLSLPMNHMPGYMPELSPMQGFPSNHRQPNFGGLGMGIAGPVGGGGNHPEALERLMEMELRAKTKQMPHASAGHGPGIYGPEIDMAFRYR